VASVRFSRWRNFILGNGFVMMPNQPSDSIPYDEPAQMKLWPQGYTYYGDIKQDVFCPLNDVRIKDTICELRINVAADTLIPEEFRLAVSRLVLTSPGWDKYAHLGFHEVYFDYIADK